MKKDNGTTIKKKTVGQTTYILKEYKNNTKRVFTGSPREPIAGYCRAIKKGNIVTISGTTATDGRSLIGKNDPEKQMTFILHKILTSVELLGGKKSDIIKTTVYISDEMHCEYLAKAHGIFFSKGNEPANTFIKAGLIGEDYLVEVSAIAVIPTS